MAHMGFDPGVFLLGDGRSGWNLGQVENCKETREWQTERQWIFDSLSK